MAHGEQHLRLHKCMARSSNAVISSRRLGCALKPNDLCTEQFCRGSSLDFVGPLTSFLDREILGTKALGERSGWYGGSKTFRYRF
jgi:hypothetical protein